MEEEMPTVQQSRIDGASNATAWIGLEYHVHQGRCNDLYGVGTESQEPVDCSA